MSINKQWIALLLSLILITNVTMANQEANIKQNLSFLANAKWVSQLPPEQPIQFTVWLTLRNKKQLDQLVKDIYDPNSISYQKFLTAEEFNLQYAPDEAIEQSVLNYFQSQGLTATLVNHSVRVLGTAREVETVLQVKLNRYRYQGSLIYSNNIAPTIIPEIAQYVSAITGLNDINYYKPDFRLPITPQNPTIPQQINLAWDSFRPSAQPTTTSIAGFTGKRLQNAYQLANIPKINGTSINGAGQTIVILDACGNTSATQMTTDANLYNKNNGIALLTTTGTTRNFSIINPNGTTYTSCATGGATGWETEIALDVQSAHTIAPNANMVLVLAGRSSDLETALSDIISTLTTKKFTIAGFSNAYVVSNSWGGAESQVYSTHMESVFEAAAAMGLNFSFSTGDCGDNTYNSAACKRFSTQASVNYPASSSYVTAVGGSSLFVDTSWNYAFETGWGTYYGGGFYFGGGGGVSQLSGPVAWQSSISSFRAGGFSSGTIGSYGKRALPDIAMLGDPGTGLVIYSAGKTQTVGGTSLAAPLFAGTLTLVNQARKLLKKSTPIGLAATYLYTQNNHLLTTRSLNLIISPHQVISGASAAPSGSPDSAFTLFGSTFGWDSSLTITPDNQFWNDVVGVGSPFLPNFVGSMALF